MSEALQQENYEHSGFTLTPASFAQVALQILKDKRIKRDEVIRLVMEHHLANGGIQGSADIVGIAKKAKRILIQSGNMVASSRYGLWDFCVTGLDAIYHAPPEKVKNNFVYAYYFPAYKELAELKGESSWPIKIGLSTTTIEQRVMMQVGTALPERPVLLFEIECDDCAKLEKAIHAALDVKGFKMPESLGNEWFCVNQNELLSLMSFFGYDDL